MNYFDSTIRAGYYDVFRVEGLDHAYAIHDRDGEEWPSPASGVLRAVIGILETTASSIPLTYGRRSRSAPEMWVPLWLRICT